MPISVLVSGKAVEISSWSPSSCSPWKTVWFSSVAASASGGSAGSTGFEEPSDFTGPSATAAKSSISTAFGGMAKLAKEALSGFCLLLLLFFVCGSVWLSCFSFDRFVFCFECLLFSLLLGLPFVGLRHPCCEKDNFFAANIQRASWPN